MRLMKISTLALALVALVFQCQMASAQSEGLLRWKLSKGQKFKVVSEQKMSNTVELPMGVQEMPMEMTATMEWEVVEASEDKFVVKTVMKRIQMSMESPLGSVNIDTDEEDQEADGQMAMMADQLANAIGEENEIEFNARGQVVKKEDDEDADEESMGPFMMGDSSEMAQMFFDLPEQAVSKGLTWKQKTENAVPGGEIVMDSNLEYVGLSENLHEIGVESEISGGMSQGGQQMDIDEGSMKGKIFFNNAAGYLERAELEQEMVMMMDAGGIAITITNESKSKMKFEPIK